MNSLFFVYSRSIKNTLKEFLRKPINVIGAVFLIGFVVLSLLSPTFAPPSAEDIEPIWILKIALFAYAGMFFAASIFQGFKNGASLFDMCDINLVFTAPLRQRYVLGYGMLKSLGRALLLCFFIIWQGALFALFGVDWRGIIIILLLFVIVMILCQFLQMAVYLLTFGRKKRKIALGVTIGALYLPLIIKAVYEFLTEATPEIAAQNIVNSPFFDFSPVIGWMSGAAANFAAELSFLPEVSGNITTAVICLLLLLILLVAATVYLINSKADFYEDAIVAGETRFALQRDIAEGNIGGVYSGGTKNAPKKLKKTGVDGFGASAIFRRQLREIFRESPLGLWDLASVGQIAAVFGVGVALGNDGTVTPPAKVIVILAMMAITQIFFISMGKGMRELFFHYIYMIPESPLKKLIWANAATLLKCTAEGVVVFAAIGIIFGAPLSLVLSAMLAYACYNFYLIGLNFAFERINIASHIMLIGIYFSAVIICLSPGITAAVLIGINAGFAPALLILSLWEVIAGFIFFALSAGVLNNMDIPQMQTAGMSIKKDSK
jgi:hypothetical protein